MATTSTFAASGEIELDGMVYGGQWQDANGAPLLRLTYSLDSNVPGTTWGAAYATAVANAFSAWSEVINIDFQRIDTYAGANSFLRTHADISLSFNDFSTNPDLDGVAAYCVLPITAGGDYYLRYYVDSNRLEYPHPEGDIVLDSKGESTSPANTGPGGYAYLTVLHEIGHALGLKHPFEASGDDHPVYNAADDGTHSLMSYDQNGGLATGNQSTPMPYDIRAVQSLYGANMHTRTGDDTYVMKDDGKVFTIWDAGGNDTLDFSKLGIALSMSKENGGMTGGAFIQTSAASSGGEAFSGVALAFDLEDSLAGTMVMENLIATKLADNVFGNTGNNRIDGMAGNDTLDGGEGGIDTLRGGAGNDVYHVRDEDDVAEESSARDGTDLVIAHTSYTLSDFIENLEISDCDCTGDADGTGNNLANVITGNDAVNVLKGMAGNDTMIGNDGSDTYYVQEKGDVVLETMADDAATEDKIEGGFDLVRAQIDYTLGANLEALELTGAAVRATGNLLDNFIAGNSIANVLRGGGGNDTLAGGKGNDLYEVTFSGTHLTENEDEGHDLVKSSDSFTLSDNLEDLTLTGYALTGQGNALDNIITGNSQANLLIGGNGNDTLDGGQRIDTFDGGDGNDVYLLDTEAEFTYLDGDGNSRYLADSSGNDTLILSYRNKGTVQTLSLGGALEDFENLVVTGKGLFNIEGNAANNALTGNASANALEGAAGDDTLEGGAGADTLIGGTGNDRYMIDNTGDQIQEDAGDNDDTVYASISFNLATRAANVEHLTLTGKANLTGTGSAADNVLTGNDGNDTLIGGAGDDTYRVNSTRDVIVELASEGVDSVHASTSYTLSAQVEHLWLNGSADYNATGNSLANQLTGNGGNNRLDGAAGNDTLTGGLGNDTYVIDAAGDVVVELEDEGVDSLIASLDVDLANFNHIENLTLNDAAITGAGNDLNNLITGNANANLLTGGLGNDTLIGGAGLDSLQGGAGDDTYVLDAAGELALLGDTGGDDTLRLGYNVSSATTLTLSGTLADFEHLIVLGTGLFHLTGNAGNNLLMGNASANALSGADGDDTLDGGAGNDTLSGGAGNDTYMVDAAGDSIVETEGAGSDTVWASISHTLSSGLENLILTGTAKLSGTGNSGDNQLTGNAGNNLLNGLTGNDTLNGGMGNDTYVVDSSGDVLQELADQGLDTVQASLDWTLGDNLENLLLTGTNAINGTGNLLNNTITGNTAANLLDGGLGADTMTGGAGNDTYVVDDAGDRAIEAAKSGLDRIYTHCNYTLGANLEELVLDGINLTGTGNELHNLLVGGAGADHLFGLKGNDTLDGGNGADTLLGGEGNDTYYVDSSADTIIEQSGSAGGTDTVIATGNFVLGTLVENLTLAGTNNLTGTGNSQNNILTGNSGNNALWGRAGNDQLFGGAGNDTLNGGAGNDTLSGGDGDDVYFIERGFGADLLIDRNLGGSNADTVAFGEGIAFDQLWFQRSGKNLQIALIGTSDRLSIQDWFSSDSSLDQHVASFSAGGRQLQNSHVDTLIAAMAGFSIPAAGQLSLNSDLYSELEPTLVNVWS